MVPGQRARERRVESETHLLGRLPHRAERPEVSLQEGHVVIYNAVLLGEGLHPWLHLPQVIPRELREEMMQRLEFQ